MTSLIERGALVLLSLPALLYASGSLLVTSDFVAMIPPDYQFPGVSVFVFGVGATLLAAAILIHVRRLRYAGGITLAVGMTLTAFCIHLPTLFVDFPADTSPEMIELTQRAAIAGVIKDLAVVGAALLVALRAREGGN
ncbi:MAG: hypothetical protein AAF602_02160 [Myxococcota bacterium]